MKAMALIILFSDRLMQFLSHLSFREAVWLFPFGRCYWAPEKNHSE